MISGVPLQISGMGPDAIIIPQRLPNLENLLHSLGHILRSVSQTNHARGYDRITHDVSKVRVNGSLYETSNDGDGVKSTSVKYLQKRQLPLSVQVPA